MSFPLIKDANALRCLRAQLNHIVLLLVCLIVPSRAFSDFIHHSDVVRDLKKKFSEISTYKAKFIMRVVDGNKNKSSSGIVHYKQAGKVNFSFHKPDGDKIISNGRKMWVYIRRLNAVGVQSLNNDQSNIYNAGNYEGLVRLFRRYHYRFDKAEQPRNVLGGSHYVLALDEKVDSGGFSNITLYVDATKKIIRKMIAISRGGREVALEFKNIELNIELPSSLFTYKIEGNVKVVENPLTVN